MLNAPVVVESPWSDRYEVQERVGEGNAGAVYRAIDVTALSEARVSREVAVKIYRNKKSFKREVQMMQRLRGHPNVVQLLTSHSVPTMAVVMPFYSAGDLHSYVWNCDGLSESQAARVTCDLLSALQHIHGLDIIHRDIKPENVSMDKNGRPVLMDFDIACKSSDITSGTLCGSPGYMAPEIIDGAPWTFASDVFAIGCVAYFMFAKMHPFPTKPMTVESILEKSAQCNLRFGRRFVDVSSECKAFISAIIVRDPDQRLSEQQASAHPWLQDAAKRLELVDSMHVERPHCKGWNSSLKSRVSKVKTIGRDVVCRLSRVLGSMRPKTKTKTSVESLGGSFGHILPNHD
eukprot:TRINITY_DN12332_c0_g1_i1.p1 TRINITY_DN12332_c0_g1~~TRINITY_DN12332_c0_g1_i1.p1  ORF type:complete len:347 (-),score=40.96 TRINITY_DN12332_c0_g1_i1:70-1110(-)